MRIQKTDFQHTIFIAFVLTVLTGCSTTEGVPEGDRLYTGIKKIEYDEHEKSEHFYLTQQELEAALACAPNGGLFGSSRYRTPLQFRLWMWNAFSKKETKFAKWMTNSFGKAPVLMSNVNSDLRATVAQSALHAHGYFRGTVSATEVDCKNPKKAKVSYHVTPGHLFTLDSIKYEHFPPEAQALIDSTAEESLLSKDAPFDISTLDGERNRITNLFRDNGYYYYQPGYASYLADTLAVPGKVRVRLQMADSLPDAALRKWYIGNLDINLRRTYMEKIDSTRGRGNFKVHYNGKKPPLRMRVLMKDMKLRPRRPFSYSDYLESVSKLSSNGLFSLVDFNFTPRDSSATCDTLDLNLNCVFDKPYDFYVEGNLKGKTSGFLGPQLVLGLTKRNAFHGGENLNINLHGSYEWQTGHAFDNSETEVNSYEYGGDISLDFPRLLVPWTINRRHRFYTTPTTTIKASRNIVNRSGYFKRHILSGEITYNFQRNRHWSHQFTPLSIEYNYLKTGSEKFWDMILEHPYLFTVMSDVFIPKLKYTITYSNLATSNNPIFWQTSITESGNILSLGYMAFGNKWNEKGKETFKNPYAQFIKIESEFTKTWKMGEYDQLVGHLCAGWALPFGNSSYLPYTESFWVGGANSVRAFTVRSLGPGSFRANDKKWRFLEQIGNIKLQANIEYRPRLFGHLYGALFLDAGNVWDSTTDENDIVGSHIKTKDFLTDLAIGTGIGLRYDLEFFVVRFDWGIGIHAPYDTGKSGYFNIPSFRDGQSFHFAIGYPF